MNSYDVVIVGGGAAGMTAAIFAKRSGKNVLLCEKMPKLGKKLLVTGAGRCNLLNEKLDPSFYDPAAQDLVRSVFAKFGKEKILGFFRELGLAVYPEPDGRIFPVTNQAASVLKVLEMEIARLGIPVELGCEVRSINVRHCEEPRKKGDRHSLPACPLFEVIAENGKRASAKAVVLCAGGRSYPVLGADGGGYGIAGKFGHTIEEPAPCTVPLLVKDPWCHHLQGQKIRAVASAWIKGKKVQEAASEVLFTQYGLSGTAVLDVSGPVSIAMNREKLTDVSVELDLVPFMTEAELEKELSCRIARGIPYENILEGLLPHKVSVAVLKGTGSQSMPVPFVNNLVRELKHKKFKVSGTRGWNEAEFTAGGVPAKEVELATLESKFQESLYLAGEILDVGGARGGYNLAWAWASGAVAGSAG